MKDELKYIASFDSNKSVLEGGKHYKLHLPANIPATDFWSVLVYDSESGLIIHTDQPWPSVHSNSSKLIVNEDGSIDVWFGPSVQPGKEYNWIKTIPGKHWNMILRLYYPTDAWFNKSWKPGLIREV